MYEKRPPCPAVHASAAMLKVRFAEDAWNTCDAARVAPSCSIDSEWRNCSQFIRGRAAIEAFLNLKWAGELEYRLIKELWAFNDNHIAVRFAYECRDSEGAWFRAYGNENWEFDDDGLNRRRIASINDSPIRDSDRCFRWDRSGARPKDHPGLSELGL